jgi:hypothetical protein
MKKPKVAVVAVTVGMLLLISSPCVHAQANAAASLAWYMYPITLPYNSSFHGSREVGEDLGTPAGTPITSLVSGQLVGAGFYGGGGVVTVRTILNGQPADLYVQHLASIVNVRLCSYGYCGGQSVSRGELLGYSGGDCVWHDGPGFGPFNACVAGFSSGPHTEVGINPPYYGIWGPSPHPGPNYDPSGTIVALIDGGESAGGSDSSTSIYVVQAGDTLAAIAGKYHLSSDQLYQLNKSVLGTNPNRIYPGEKLRIPSS